MSAPVLPRRHVLLGLAASPVAFGVPAALPALSPSPDAVLIALAARVERLAQRYEAACMRCCDIEGRVEALEKPPASHEAAMAAWEAEKRALADRHGLPAMDRLCSRVNGRLQVASAALERSAPSTFAGLQAKARAIAAVSGDGAFGDFWITRLELSLVRNVLALGGGL